MAVPFSVAVRGKETILVLFVSQKNKQIFFLLLYLEKHLSSLSLVSPHQRVVPSLHAQEVIKQLSASI